MEDYKSVFYGIYGDEIDPWKAFEEINHPLEHMKYMLTRGRKLTRIEETVKRCKKNIKGFVDEIDEEGWHHFMAPLKYFTAEYWQKSNCTQISFNETLAKELKLEKRIYEFKGKYWRYDYQLTDFDYDIKDYLKIKHWFETDKPQDDEVYYSIVNYLKPFEDNIWYNIHFNQPDCCTVDLNPKNLDSSLGSTRALIHYKTCIPDLKSAVSLLLMKQLMRTKENIMELEQRQEVILGLVERVN